MKNKANLATTITTFIGTTLSVIGGIVFYFSYDLHHFRPPMPLGAYVLYILFAVSMVLGLLLAVAIIIYQKIGLKKFAVIILSALALAFILGIVLLCLLLFYGRLDELPTLIMIFFMGIAYLLSIIFSALAIKSHGKTNSNILVDETCEGDKKNGNKNY